MKLIKKIMSKIFYFIMLFFSICRIILYSLIYKKRIYLFGIPVHGNLGDQAILISELKFLDDNFKDYKIILVESNIVLKFNLLLKKLIGKSLILISGGGFLGSLWMEEEKMFRKTIQNFPNNTIIVLPQTIYFSNDDYGLKILNDSKKIYSSHKNLYICCREIYSHDFMKKEFENCSTLLIPDMVLKLNGTINKNYEDRILFCIRRDKEKVEYNFKELESYLNDYAFDYTDMVIDKNIYWFNRNKIITSKIEQFSRYKLVITDRLHGMIFSLLAGTPCLVYENKSYKIKGVYKWINHIKTVKLYNKNTITKDLSNLLHSERYKYSETEMSQNYNKLIELIKNNL